jgi:hypothetical protein
MRQPGSRGLRTLFDTLLRLRIGAVALVFVFLAGAALAGGYSALAGEASLDPEAISLGLLSDSTSTGDESTTSTVAEETTTTVETSTEVTPTPTTTQATDGDGTDASTTTEAPPPAPSDGSDGPPPPSGEGAGSEPAPGPVLAPKHHHVRRAPETAEGGSAIVWLHRVLPDPTPAARRLSPAFARDLRMTAKRSGVRWNLILAVLRARGHDGRVPAGPVNLERLADRLAASRRAVLGRGEFASRVRALSRYNRAVTLRALVTGLEAAKPRLERKVLRDPRISIYPGGRVDIALHHVDVRVIVLIRYLRMTFRDVTVTSLVSGHRYYARPGVVSAHMYGLAVDVAVLGGIPIAGHQEPGDVTEKAVEAILLLPAELQPQQVISLLGLGGPSFPLADHYDHIHVGF